MSCTVLPGAQFHHDAVPSPSAARWPEQAEGSSGETRRVRFHPRQRASCVGSQEHQLPVLPQPRVRASQCIWSAGAQAWISHYSEGILTYVHMYQLSDNTLFKIL